MQKTILLAAIVIVCSTSIVHAQYGGDPRSTYTNQMVRDHIALRHAASARRSASKAAAKRKRKTHSVQLGASRPVPLNVPQIQGLAYSMARQKLIAFGWKPVLHSRNYEKSSNIQGGNGPVFWKKGYYEITESSGTGQAFCRFLFTGKGKKRLSVVTAGEEDPSGRYRAVVKNYSLEASPK